LAIAEHHAIPGKPMPLETLARFCGCSDATIYHIEKDALKKLRNRLLFMKDPAITTVVEELILRVQDRRPATKTPCH